MLRVAAVALLLVSGLISAKDFTPCYACEKYENSYSESVKQCRKIGNSWDENECLSAELKKSIANIPKDKINAFNKKATQCKKQADKDSLTIMSGGAIGITLSLCEIYAATH